MSRTPYAQALYRGATDPGPQWQSHEVKFREQPVLAYIQLTAFMIQDDEQFSSFQPHMALAYLETENTPRSDVGYGSGPNADKLRDNHAWLVTDHIVFQLEIEGVAYASALCLLHYDADEPPTLATTALPLDLAVFDKSGLVIGTHKVVQLEGGAPIDVDEVQERVLASARARAGDEVDVVPIDLSEIPTNAGFRIDLRTRRPIPLDNP